MTLRVKDTDRGLKRIQQRVRRVPESEVLVGILEGEIANYAAVQEFGSRNVQAKSFIRSTFDQNVSTYDAIMTRGATFILAGESDPRQTLTRVGIKMKADVVKKITALGLIDTGAMRASVDFDIRVRG